jgi:hypothetical protein
MSRVPRTATPPELDSQRARRLDLRHGLGFVPHGNRAKTGLLRSALDQTDGLMAFGSDRDQKEDVDRGRLQFLQQLRDGFGEQGHNVVHAAGAVVRFRHLADNFLPSQLDQPLGGGKSRRMFRLVFRHKPCSGRCYRLRAKLWRRGG